MREYCITFGNEEGEGGTEVYHCHITAPTDGIAVSAALEAAMQQNISLKGTTLVAVKVIIDIPSDVMEGYEALRMLRHYDAAPSAAPKQPPLATYIRPAKGKIQRKVGQ